jgi:ABC-type uncharacterized transport system ATPase subunit
MSILYGFYKADSGEIRSTASRPDPRQPKRHPRRHRHGVPAFQAGAELSPCWKTSSSAPRTARCWALARQGAEANWRLAREYDLEVDPDALIEDLSVGHQQRVEILKALYRRPTS